MPVAADLTAEDVTGQHLALALHLDEATLLDDVAAVAQNLKMEGMWVKGSTRKRLISGLPDGEKTKRTLLFD